MKRPRQITTSPSAEALLASLGGVLRAAGSRIFSSVLIAMLGVLLVTAVPASAAPPETPELKVMYINASEASFLGVLSPKAPNEGGTYRFLYNASKTECKGGSETSPGLSLAEEGEKVSERVGGLTANTEYTVCLRVTNLKGEQALSAPVTFKTALSLEAPETLMPEPVGGYSATLRGVLNPKSEGEPGHYRFFYQAGTECTGENEKKTPFAPYAGHSLESVQFEVSGLTPATQYTVCLEVEVGDEETAVGAPVTFTTPSAAPAVGNESFAHVGSAGASVMAQVNPGALPSTYHVEYGVSESYGSSTPEQSVGAGNQPVGVSAQLNGLQPGTVYHFRFVASNERGTVPGSDTTFTTLPSGLLGLPDGRAYEMVTPVSNEDADVYTPEVIDSEFGKYGIPTHNPFEASTEGDAVAYAGSPTSGGNGNGGSQKGDEYVAKRSPTGGWTQLSMQPSLDRPRYEAFSPELSEAVLCSTEALAGDAPAGYENLYRTTSEANRLYQPLVTVPPTPARSTFEFFGAYNTKTTYECKLAFAGASSDFGHLLFEANAALPSTPEADNSTEPTENNLYDSTGGALSLVNVLPDGKAEPDATFGAMAFLEGGTEGYPDFSHVISADGSKVFWTDLHPGPDEDHIFVRENGSVTVPVSAGAARFWNATREGEYVFYIEGEKLMRFDLEKYREELEHGVSEDQALGESREELSPSALAVLGSSETNGEYVYYVDPSYGLHVWHDGVSTSIAGLAALDGSEARPFGLGSNAEVGDWQPSLATRTAAVTPDGHELVFMSRQRLTGYDNEDPKSGDICLRSICMTPKARVSAVSRASAAARRRLRKEN